MQIAFHEDAKAVLEFMQSNVPTNRLLGVAEALPQMARLLWSGYPQEPLSVMRLESEPIKHETQSIAI